MKNMRAVLFVLSGLPMLVSPMPTGEVLIIKKPSELEATEDATYDCELYNLWTKARHPKDFPSDVAHWSKPVAVSHSTEYVMYRTGELASPGVEDVAETGETGEIEMEIMNSDGTLNHIVADNFDAKLTSVSEINGLTFDDEHPYLSVITMIAPSPDWFTGVANLDMRDASTDTWIATLVLDLFPKDAGTDSGMTYKAGDADTNPAKPISLLTTQTIPTNGVLKAPKGSGLRVLPVARLQCQLRGADAPNKKEVTESCTKDSNCEVGLICKGKNNKKCLPCNHATQKCKSDGDCCGSLECNSKNKCA